jgi:hypothetical protein
MRYGSLSLALFLVSTFTSACDGGVVTDLDSANAGGDGDGDNSGGASGDGDDSGGDGDGSGGDGDDNNDGVCEEFPVGNSRAVPDMMLVLDRSGSMARGVDRWTPSVSAIGTLTSKYEDSVRFGLMVFPADDGCGTGELLVPINLNSAGAIANALARETPEGGTPTSATLERAYEELEIGVVGPDETPVVKFVLLVTDGQPTCPSAGGTVDAPEGVSQAEHELRLQEDHERTLDAIEALADEGVRTYVVGYDAALDPLLVAALSEFAAVGGTGDYHPVQNEAELDAEFAKISGEVVSCTFALDEEPQDPRYVQIELDGTPIYLDDPDGWSIAGTTVSVQGDACATLQDGGEHTLDVRILCDVVVPD